MKKVILPLAAGLLLLSCAVSKKTSKQSTAQNTAVAKADTTKKDSVKKIKPYREVITSKAITQNGLFKVHKVADRWFFEIPDSLFDRDLLLVNRISKGNFNGPFTSYSGDDLGSSLIQLTKGPNNKVFIKQMNYILRAAQDEMRQTVDNSNTQALMAAFDIKTVSPDSSGVVVDVTDYLNADNDFFFIPNFQKTTLGYALGGYQADKSYVQGIRSFPENIEIKTIKTFVIGADPRVVPPGNVTFEINNSIVLLPKEVMKPRYNDPRVGYFAWSYYNFDAAKPVNTELLITRWRLEPKPEDVEKYKRGELVEPQKPIVFYIDPATPKRWVPYLMEGVNSWQKAFEKAGFKNAIYALEAPVDDTSWSLEDARHNVIVYKASSTQNASGPHVGDPRSGEILESHVQWFHNVQQLLHDWYFIQASPNDPQARKMLYDDALMGKLIRYVCAHEIGHTLGLQHNFFSSATVPVDSLRSKTYVRANGFCTSIMDYARFNYVAQPEDGMEQQDLFPRIGAYDEWAIEWGYKWLPGLSTKEEERAYMNQWIISRLEKDKRLAFRQQTMIGENIDPLCQTEDLGDDAVKAGRYGIANLKRIVPNLTQWAKLPNEGYESLRRMNNQVFQQYVRYLNHAVLNLGGEIRMEKTVEEKGPTLFYPSRAIQKATVQFLQDELFTRPSWLMNSEIYRLTAEEGTTGEKDYFTLFQQLNKEILGKLFSNRTLFKLRTAQVGSSQIAYTTEEFIKDLEKGFWKELNTQAPIDMYRRDLQKLYVDQFISLLDSKKWRDGYSFLNANSDIYPLLKQHLLGLLAKINTAIPTYKDPTTRYHLMELKDRIRNTLYGRDGLLSGSPGADASNAVKALKTATVNDVEARLHQNGCWADITEGSALDIDKENH